MPIGTIFSFGTHVFCQKDFSGAPSTQELTLRRAPSNSKINPCTIAPLHLGHRVGFALMFQLPMREWESPVFRRRDSRPAESHRRRVGNSLSEPDAAGTRRAAKERKLKS